MRYVSATDAKQTLAAVLDAAQREPVMIRRQNRDVAVLLCRHEYDRIAEPAAARTDRGKLAEILAEEG